MHERAPVTTVAPSAPLCAPSPQQQQPHSFHARFALLNKVGDGMTATVYIVRDRLLTARSNTMVAKVAEERDRRTTPWWRIAHLMQHESSLLRSVGCHPNIVMHHGFFESPGHSALILDLVAGGDCQQLLQRQGVMPEPIVHSMALQLHAALAHLVSWQRGMVVSGEW